MSIVLLVFPRYIARFYTANETVIHSATILLMAGAAFQLFDGIQTVATGSLRGTGDTRTPMLCHFSAYWLIGLPARRLPLLPQTLGRPRPMDRPKPQPDPDRHPPTPFWRRRIRASSRGTIHPAPGESPSLCSRVSRRPPSPSNQHVIPNENTISSQTK